MPTENRYIFTEPESQSFVAFIDILGFGHRVMNDFDAIVEIYDEMAGKHLSSKIEGNFTVRLESDAFVITSTDFFQIIRMSQLLHGLALKHDCLVRGGIGFGRHLEAKHGGNYFVVSQALTQAVAVEKAVKHPCIAFHESIPMPSFQSDQSIHPTQRGLLFYEGQWVICPFHSLWQRSARDRVSMMWEQYPQHAEKFRWFIEFYKTIFPEDI